MTTDRRTQTDYKILCVAINCIYAMCAMQTNNYRNDKADKLLACIGTMDEMAKCSSDKHSVTHTSGCEMSDFTDLQ